MGCNVEYYVITGIELEMIGVSPLSLFFPVFYIALSMSGIIG